MTRSLILVSFFLFSFITGSLTNDKIEPWKIPTVVGILEKVLNDFEQKGFSIPEVDLGEDVGRFSDIRAEASGKFEKVVKPVGSFGFDLSLNAEKIAITGFYDIQNIELPELFPIFGKGDFSIELEGLNLAICIQVTQDFATGNFKTKIKNFILSVEKSTIKFDNLMNDPDLADFLNELLSSLIPDLIQVFYEQVTPLLEFVVGYVMNKVIYCIKNEALSGKLEECLKNITILGYDIPEILNSSPSILTSLS